MIGIRAKAVLCAMIVLHVAMVVHEGRRNAPLIDEPRHLVIGTLQRQFGRFDLCPVNPPLVSVIASLATAWHDVEYNWALLSSDPLSHSETRIAVDFAERQGAEARAVTTLARWLCLPFTVLGAWTCFTWSAELFGEQAGLVSAACWCWCPTVLGSAGVVLPDLPAAAMAIFAAWTYWCWLRRPCFKTLGVAALALGLSFLAKTTLLLLVAPFCAAYAVVWWRRRKSGPSKDSPTVRGLIAIVIGAGYILNLAYGFEGTGKCLGDYEFVSPTMNGLPMARYSDVHCGNRFRGTILAYVPVPLPHSYVTGIDIQKRDFDIGLRSYLRGNWDDRGWWYYYLYALLVKTPIPLILLTGIGVAVEAKGRVRRNAKNAAGTAADVLLVGFPIVMLAVASSQTGFSHHLRYIFPAFPFWFVWLGRVAVLLSAFRLGRSVLAVLLSWLALEAPFCHPHELSYFNELVGGPSNGHCHLLESNCDWGQGLYLAEEWVAQHPEARPLVVDYYGLTSAGAYGGFSEPGVFVESASGWQVETLSEQGLEYWVCVSVHNLHKFENRYRNLQRRQPVDRIGYSMLVYHVRSR